MDHFNELANAADEAEFLQRLERSYAQLGIGEGLDFGAVRQYWQNGVELPRVWRQALAQRLCLTRTEFDRYQDRFRRLYAWALAERAPEHWLDCWERLVVLLSPFVTPGDAYYYRHWLPGAGGGPVRLNTQVWAEALGESMRDWAGALAEGVRGWEGVYAWLVRAGVNPACLAEALAAPDMFWDEQRLRALAGMRLFLILVREQLQREALGEDVWIDLLLGYRQSVAGSFEHVFPARRAIALRHQLLLPLLQALAASPRLYEVLQLQEGRNWPMVEVFRDLGLALVLGESAERFAEVLERLPDAEVRLLWRSDLFCERCPAAALRLEQHRFERCGVFDPNLKSPEALAWYRQVIDRVPVDSDGFKTVMKLLSSELAEDELQGLIDRLIAPAPQAKLGWELLGGITLAEPLCAWLESCNESLRERAAERLHELAIAPAKSAERLLPEVWDRLVEASQRYPALFIGALSSERLVAGEDSVERWLLLWRACEEAEPRVQLLSLALSGLGGAGHAGLLALLETLYGEAPELFRRFVEEHSNYYLPPVIAALGRQDTPLLALVPLMAGRCFQASAGSGARSGPLSAAVCRALVAFPEAFASLESKAQLKLLPLFDDVALVACGPALVGLFAGSSKTLREPAVALLARCAPQAIEASGLLQAAPRARRLALIGMALSADPAMAGPILRHIDDAAHDDYSRSISLDALERAGQPLDGLDPWAGADLAALQAQVGGRKVPAAVGKCWSPELAELLAPLGEPLAKHLLVILAEGGEALPRRARQILAWLPAGRRSDFALLCVVQWIAANGATAVDWLLLPLAEYGDERAANALVKAVKDWKKVRKLKASAAIHLLCRLPGSYGVSQVRELWESGKFSESILANARQALSEAAERRGMGLEEFLEQLVPDFGLDRDGLQLDLGPWQYRVRIRPDLSLVVVNEKGKASKSLPKARAGEDPDLRSLAENQYKALAKNLKPVLKQQAARLTRALQLGSRWPAASWRRLFAEHPLLAIVSQTVVWAAEDADGQPLGRFRPDQAGELIDLQDEPFTLADDAQVHVAHPLELDEAERTAWAEHFADYELLSPIGQWETAVHQASAEELGASELTRAEGSRLQRGRFGGLLEKWGYIKGEAGDGAMVNDHTWTLDGERWRITLAHDGISVFFDPDEEVEIGALSVEKREAQEYRRQCLGELPPALLNTLLAQAETLKAEALA